MLREQLFTEEGRVSRKSRSIWLYIMAVLAMIACIVGYQTFQLFVADNFSALQTYYFSQYAKAAIRLVVFQDSSAEYTTLNRIEVDPKTKKRNGYFCLDSQVVADRDEKGLIRADKAGNPIFFLRREQVNNTKEFYWETSRYSDEFIYKFFKGAIYENRSFIVLFYPSMFTGAITFIAGIIATASYLNYRRKQALLGKFVRGTQSLTPRQYTRKMRKADGIGIDIFKVN